MSEPVLLQAVADLRQTQAWYKEHAVYERYKLSPIWMANLQNHFDKILPEADKYSIAEVIAYLGDKAFFDVSAPDPQKPYAINWYMDLLKKEYPAILNALPDKAGESPYFNEGRCEMRDGRRISSDFLSRLCMIGRMRRTVPITGHRETVVELGSGSGNLARAFRYLYPNSTYICIDIPESLFFAHVNMAASFPEAKVLYVHDTTPIANVEDYDFIFIPTEYAATIAGESVDVFINTNSLGEMRNEIIAHWFDYIQTKIATRHVFLLNRFLNRLPESMQQFRVEESACSLSMDRFWDIMDWEVDPDFESCPYACTLLTRNLLVVARRNTDAKAIGMYEDIIVQKIPAIRLQDWAVHPHWVDYKYALGGTNYPPLNSKADMNFKYDVTIRGTLCILWEYYRLQHTRDAAGLLLQWMITIGGAATPFEEAYYLCGKVQGAQAA